MKYPIDPETGFKESGEVISVTMKLIIELAGIYVYKLLPLWCSTMSSSLLLPAPAKDILKVTSCRF